MTVTMKAPRRISLGAGAMHSGNSIFTMQITIVGGCGLQYGAVCARRTGRQQVKVGSAIPKKQKDGAKCLHFFCHVADSAAQQKE